MTRVERRRPAFTADLVARVSLIWLFAAIIFVAARWQAIAGLQLPDADDTLRLVQLRDLVAGQAWFDLHQYRVNPPHGMLMHWSRLVDAPLLIVHSALAPILGPDMAERIAIVLVPLMTLYAALLLTGRLAWRMIGDAAIGPACIVLVLAGAVAGQMQPLRIDHHGWQIVCLLAAMNGLAARDAVTGGRIAGAALALGMTISLELLPLAALVGAVLALRWIADQQAKILCINYLQALTVIAGLAFVATRGLGDLGGHCDTLSLPYLAGLAVMALGLTALSLRQPVPPSLLIGGFASCAGVAAWTVLTLAPQCRGGPFAALDPLVQSLWYDNIREGMPIWRQDLGTMLRMLVPPLAGLAATAQLWRGNAGWLRRFWFEYLLISAGALALALMVSRAAGFANALAAVPLGWMLHGWYLRAKTLRRIDRRIGLLAAGALVLMPDLPLQAARLASPARSPAGPSAQTVCDISAAGPALAALSPRTLFAQIDIGPQLLLHTGHSVVATAHHRAPQALHDIIAAFTADPARAEQLIRAHGAGLVVICPDLPETMIYREAAPKGLMADLVGGKAPVWLRPLPSAGYSGLMVWEVVPAQAGTKASASPFMQ
ncbi:MAG: hypothetical protein J0M19_02945 [Sphingomonadales bacterium]|nr:hypothetical protein [Sphingomonadales bacterium]